MENLPLSLSVAFGLTTALAVGIFYWAARRSGRTLAAVLAWLLLQGVVAGSGFYANTAAGQPRLALLLGPPLLAIAGLFLTAAGRRYLDGLRLDALTLLHAVRVPVELVLFGLFLHRAVPQLMTFEGRNWDVLAGLTAPVVYYFAFGAKRLGPRGLLAWNVAGLGSLLNIVAIALLSAPTPFQRLAFAQPNVAILHFPFALLPGCVVPLVLLAHLAAIRQLVLAGKKRGAKNHRPDHNLPFQSSAQHPFKNCASVAIVAGQLSSRKSGAVVPGVEAPDAVKTVRLNNRCCCGPPKGLGLNSVVCERTSYLRLHIKALTNGNG